VWLVGAGPGDPGLVTVRALRCIESADAILHDCLVNEALLEHARPDCQILCSGKRAGRHSMPQDETQALLVRLASEGKRVCRLKGGDPLMFGRGGEEALYLREHGVPYEVVPGVSSALAAPAYAGIPISHRGLSACVHVVTGHEAPGKAGGQVDWENLARASGTLVFLMGLANLDAIARRLMAGSWAPATPAAVIAHGTLPTQRTVTGTLADISKRVADASVEAPAVVVVGEATGMRDELAWFEKRPLFGRTIVATRPRAQAQELAETLRELGAEVILAPTLRIEIPAENAALGDAVARLDEVDWLVFTSGHGVAAFFEALEKQGKDARDLHGLRTAAIGPATAERLRRAGVRADCVPPRYEAAALLEALCGQDDVAGRTFLLPRSNIARPYLVDGLRARGARVVDVAAYHALPGDPLPPDLLDRLEGGHVDLVLFSSPSTVRHFIEAMPEGRREGILPKAHAAAIGPVTAGALEEARIPIRVTAAEYTIPGLVDAIVEHFAGQET